MEEHSLVFPNRTDLHHLPVGMPAAWPETATPTAVSMLVAEMASGHEALAGLFEEFSVYCPNVAEDCCRQCDADRRCRDRLSAIFIRYLEVATALTCAERKIIMVFHEDPRYREAFDQHLFLHDMMINDISDYVMACDRGPMDVMINAALSTLVLWLKGPMMAHDKVLLEIALGWIESC